MNNNPEYRVVEEESFGSKVFNVERNFEGKWFPWVPRNHSHSEAIEAMQSILSGEAGLRFVAGLRLVAGSLNIIEATAEAVLVAATEKSGITLFGFGSKEEAEAVASKLPKQVKAKAITFRASRDLRLEGINCNYTLRDSGKVRYTDFEAYGVCVSISELNANTGDINEAGIKRIKSFVKGMIGLGFIK